MVNIITSVFSWISDIIAAMSQMTVIDNWTLLDFYIYPTIFIIVIKFVIKIFKNRKNLSKHE